MRIAYLAHDLSDPAVARRVAMLEQGGAHVILAGFVRDPARCAHARDSEPVRIGRSVGGRLVHRTLALARALLLHRRWAPAFAGADLLIARNLEMAILGRWLVPPSVRIVYEALDIHRLLSSPGLAGYLMRCLERICLRRASLLIVSSQAFVDNHFRWQGDPLPPVLLIENKVLDSERQRPAAHDRADRGSAGRIRIGWFGVLRCRRSLDLLDRITRLDPARIEVVIRGMPSLDAIPDFHAVVAANPALSFGGAYDRKRDLAGLYGGIDVVWAIDFFEDGANSAWLLPNRLYEGCLYGAVPIALATVQTGRWLAERGCGLRVEGASPEALADLIGGIDDEHLSDLKRRLALIDIDDLVCGTAECRRIVATLEQCTR